MEASGWGGGGGPCFRVLGPLAAGSDDDPITVAGPKRRALLARLLITPGEVISTDRLVDDLWSGQPPPGAWGTLQSHVSHLRHDLRGLGPVIETHRPGYRLAIPLDWVDAPRFERSVATALSRSSSDRLVLELDEALQLWRGRPFGEFEDAQWARAAAVRLKEVRVRAVDARFDGLLALGRHAEALPELATVLERSPLREAPWLQLMEALCRCGRPTEALRVGQQLRAALADVGIEPSREVHRLEETILRHRAPVDPPAGRSTPLGRTPADDGLPFVGRQEPMRRIHRAIDSTQRGQQQVLLVSGEPGIGKSRLLAEAGLLAGGAGALVLSGRCDGDLQVPYQPLVEALGQLVRHHEDDPGALVTALGRWPEELVHLVPDLIEVLPTPSRPGQGNPHLERHRLFQAVADWLRVMSSIRPVVLAFDDVHGATPLTLLLLRHVARATEGHALCLVLAWRSTEVDDVREWADLLGDLSARPNVTRIHLEGLDEEDLGELIRRWSVAREAVGGLDGAAFAGPAHAFTGGNPLYLGELIRHLAEVGEVTASGREIERTLLAMGPPPNITDLVTQRLRRLTPGTIDLLENAAVLGGELDLPMVQRMTGLDEATLAIAFDESIEARFLDRVSDRDLTFRFCHVLLRQTVARRVTGVRRTLLDRTAIAARQGAASDDGPRRITGNPEALGQLA